MIRCILKFTAIGCGGVLALLVFIASVETLNGGGDTTSTPERADAEPRIKVSCDVYATNRVDPIADSEHLHRQIGNTSLTN